MHPSRLFLLLILATLLPGVCLRGNDQPNFVFIVSEDNSIHYLQHFFEGGAKAPNIEGMAAHGLTFDNAFSNAAVCSVARTTLATGCLAPRIGTQFHRRYEMAPLPEGLKMWSAYLREAGYYATNNSKEDYNAIKTPDTWDASSNRATWRNRSEGQPFFHMESHTASHEGRLHFSRQTFEEVKTKHDPAQVKLADYHPDTEIFRYTHAHYLDCMTKIDEIVGATLAKLEEDGVLEDTFVFYFGDHGGVLPRGKGYLYDNGVHVPLVVRIPENFKHLVDAEYGARTDGFVSFIDFGPTVLELAGLPVPEQVDGEPFLGAAITKEDLAQRDEVFLYADRFDEKYDLIRSIRKGRFQYMRFYQPHLPDGLNNNYRYKALAYLEWRELYRAGKLEGAPLQFFQPKPVEALFDCEADPHTVNNLAADPAHAATLLELRGLLQARVKNLPDLSFYPESHLAEHAMDNPVAFGRSHKAEIAELIEIADLALLPFEEAQPQIGAALASDNPMHRYWAAMTCASFGKTAAPLAEKATALLEDDELVVRIRAAEFLGLIGHLDPRPVLTQVINESPNAVEVTEALGAVVLFHDMLEGGYRFDVPSLQPAAQGADIDDRLNYLKGDPYPAKAKKGKGKKKPVAPKKAA